MHVHVLAYSMGAFVVREAFDDADDRRRIAAVNWTVSLLRIRSTPYAVRLPLSISLPVCYWRGAWRCGRCRNSAA